MKRIALIIPYFGKFKDWFQLFLTSCKNNPSIDWIIFTDDRSGYNYPRNVRVNYMTFSNVKERIQANFDFPICLDTPYKLCDYKPTYGEVFSEELEEYDFWGYCDTDLIFGNIRKFLTAEVLNQYPKIFTRGHLSLYKNDPSVNSFYRNMGDSLLHEVFTHNQPYAFDEWGGVSRYWQSVNKMYYDELCMDDIRPGYSGFRPTKEIHGYGSPYNFKNRDFSSVYKRMHNIVYSYENGSLYRCFLLDGKYKREEVIYTHFQKRNLFVDELILHELLKDEKWIIIPNRFVKHEELNKDVIKRISPDKYGISDAKLDLKCTLSKFYHSIHK